MRLLIVVDMQKDFVDGALGTAEAQAIVPAVCEKIQMFDGAIIVTQDTHQANYLDTQEGSILPARSLSRIVFRTLRAGSWTPRFMPPSRAVAMLPSAP